MSDKIWWELCAELFSELGNQESRGEAVIEKPKQYYDTRRHQLYYQWSESEYFCHQEPIYDRTRDYIEALEAENAKLRELAKGYEAITATLCNERNSCDGCQFDEPEQIVCKHMRMQECLSELGIEVDK